MARLGRLGLFAARASAAGPGPGPVLPPPPGRGPRLVSTARRRPQRARRWPALGASALALGAAAWYLLAPERPAATLNDASFVPYAVTARDAVSPTSVLLTVAPPPQTQPGSASRRRLALWSVEFKQPELQIARHYTPLPPAEAEGGAGLLRFYVRAVAGGELSSYLTRLAVGQDVWLRGPHAGFDVLARLGDQRRVVFLAGGAGLVPAMQVAAAVLDASDDATMTLLWAVRRRDEVQAVDAHAPRPSSPWWSPWSASRAPTQLRRPLAAPTPIASHLQQLQAKYGERLDVRIAVDDEDTAIREADIAQVLAPLARPRTPRACRGCPCHDQRLHADASEFAALDPPCRCPSPAGKKLLFISGPDGFVAHYAGPKAWLRGTLTQGPVGGVAARLQDRYPGLADDWLVLKL